MMTRSAIVRSQEADDESTVGRLERDFSPGPQNSAGKGSLRSSVRQMIPSKKDFLTLTLLCVVLIVEISRIGHGDAKPIAEETKFAVDNTTTPPNDDVIIIDDDRETTTTTTTTTDKTPEVRSLFDERLKWICATYANISDKAFCSKINKLVLGRYKHHCFDHSHFAGSGSSDRSLDDD